MSEDKIELVEMIADLRRQLLEAQNQGKDLDLKFRVDEIEVELQVTVTKEAGASGGVKFWVFNAEAQDKASSAAVQKLRLKLKPLAGEGQNLGPLEMSDFDERPKS